MSEHGNKARDGREEGMGGREESVGECEDRGLKWRDGWEVCAPSGKVGWWIDQSR